MTAADKSTEQALCHLNRRRRDVMRSQGRKCASKSMRKMRKWVAQIVQRRALPLRNLCKQLVAKRCVGQSECYTLVPTEFVIGEKSHGPGERAYFRGYHPGFISD
jgi:hypothetical protein